MVLVAPEDVVHEEDFVGDHVQLQQLLEVLAPPDDVLQVVVVPGGIAGREQSYVFCCRDVPQEVFSDGAGVFDFLAEFAEGAVFFFLITRRRVLMLLRLCVQVHTQWN